MTLDTQMTLALLQELITALRANDVDGYKAWLALGIEELGRDVAGEVESEWMVPLLVEEERDRLMAWQLGVFCVTYIHNEAMIKTTLTAAALAIGSLLTPALADSTKAYCTLAWDDSSKGSIQGPCGFCADERIAKLLKGCSNELPCVSLWHDCYRCLPKRDTKLNYNIGQN